AGRNKALDQTAAGNAANGGESQRVQREVLGRAEFDREADQQRRQKGQADGGQGTADEGRHRRQRQRLAATPLERHGVAVERGHHGRLVAREVKNDGADADSIHTTVVDADQKNERRRRRQVENERQRNQQRAAAAWPQPGQRPDQRAQGAADERQQQMLRLHGDDKAMG